MFCLLVAVISLCTSIFADVVIISCPLLPHVVVLLLLLGIVSLHDSIVVPLRCTPRRANIIMLMIGVTIVMIVIFVITVIDAIVVMNVMFVFVVVFMMFFIAFVVVMVIVVALVVVVVAVAPESIRTL